MLTRRPPRPTLFLSPRTACRDDDTGTRRTGCGATLACGATGRSGERVTRSGPSSRERGCDGAGLAERREAVCDGRGSGRWAEEKGGERSGPPGFAGPRGEGKRRWRAGPLRVLGWMLGLVFLSISLFLILIQTQAKRIQINLNSNSNQTTKEKMLQHECNNKV